MIKIASKALSKHFSGWFIRISLVVSLFSLYLIGLAGLSSPAQADSMPGGNVTDPVVRAVDIAKPAIVRIITLIGAQLTVHFSNGTDVTFPQNDPNGYPLALSGSGTFITAHGDILTADHVVNPPHDTSLSDFLDTEAAPDVAMYLNQHSNQQVNKDDVAAALSSGQLPSTPIYGKPESEVFLSTDFTGPLTGTTIRDIPASVHAKVDRIEQESAVTDKDVAIIHVNMNDMASIQLGNSANVQEQDQLTIIGFPGNGDVSMRPTDLFTSSINKIIVSSIKTTDSGAQVIQVGGNVEHGDSGGPALDNQGQVVGIVSFGANTGSTSFLQASNSARTLVQSLQLDTTPGTFQKMWSQAFVDYSSTTPGHWHKARQEFQKIAASYPLFQAVTPYLNYTTDQAKHEQLPTPTVTQSSSGLTGLFIALGVLLLLLALGIGGFLLLRAQGQKKNQGVAAAYAGGSQTPAPASWQQGYGTPSSGNWQSGTGQPAAQGYMQPPQQRQNYEQVAFTPPPEQPAPRYSQNTFGQDALSYNPQFGQGVNNSQAGQPPKTYTNHLPTPPVPQGYGQNNAQQPGSIQNNRPAQPGYGQNTPLQPGSIQNPRQPQQGYGPNSSQQPGSTQSNREAQPGYGQDNVQQLPFPQRPQPYSSNQPGSTPENKPGVYGNQAAGNDSRQQPASNPSASSSADELTVRGNPRMPFNAANPSFTGSQPPASNQGRPTAYNAQPGQSGSGLESERTVRNPGLAGQQSFNNQPNQQGFRYTPGQSSVPNVPSSARSEAGEVTQRGTPDIQYPWPCGHMNTPDVQYCRTCGAPRFPRRQG